MYCWGGSSEKPYGQKDLSREDLSQGGEVVMRFLRTICVLAIMLIASLPTGLRSEEHTSELQSRFDLVCRLLLEKKKKNIDMSIHLSTTILMKSYIPNTHICNNLTVNSTYLPHNIQTIPTQSTIILQYQYLTTAN